jgi:hypothetical protein
MSETIVIPQGVNLTALTNRCGSCKHRYQGDKDIECRAHPPHGTVLLVPGRAGAPVIQTFSVYPLVKDNLWCGEWTPRERDKQ